MNKSLSAFAPCSGAVKWPQVIFSLFIVSLYSLVFSLFLVWLLPDDATNVNTIFTKSFWKLLIILSTVLLVLYFFFCKKLDRDNFKFERPTKKSFLTGCILSLLPLTPIVQYVLKNQDILSEGGSLTIVAGFAGFSFLFVAIVPAAFSYVGSTRILAAMGVAFSFTITNMATLTAHFKWYEQGNLIVQLGLLFSIAVVGLILMEVVGRRFTLFVIVLYFLANSFNNSAFFNLGESKGKQVQIESKMVELVGGREPITKPDIYFLVYDAYVPNETMRGYGIDNSEQENYLKGEGFQFYPETYSITAATVTTISRVFSVSREYYGEPRTAASGDGVVQRLLQSWGYQTYGVFWGDYIFQNVGSSYNFSFPEIMDPHWMLGKAILMGEFRFDFEFAKPSRAEFLAQKEVVFGATKEAPAFVYMHDNFPGHTQNSGKCLPDEIDKFEERLKIANDEMKKNVGEIIHNHPDAIVIVAGDHGPFLTKNCHHTHDEYDISEISRLDVQDRYGTFLAIKWPNGKYSNYDDITIIQDLFPAIFSYLFEDEQFLSARIVPTTGSAGVLTSGVVVRDGVIDGGINDGEPLFLESSDTSKP